MARIEFLIQGEEDKGPIDLDASLANLREMLERADNGQQSTVTVHLRSEFTVGGRDQSGQLVKVWQSRDWVVYDKHADPDIG